jgi:hypothetical protein
MEGVAKHPPGSRLAKLASLARFVSSGLLPKNKTASLRPLSWSHRATQEVLPIRYKLPEAPAGFLGWLLGGGFLLRRPLRFAGALLCCFARRLLLAGCHDSSFRNAKLALANLAKNNYRIKLANYYNEIGGIFYLMTRSKIEQQTLEGRKK